MIQKNKQYKNLSLGAGCAVIGIIALAVENPIGVLLIGGGIGIMVLSIIGLLKLKFLTRCAKAFSDTDFSPEKLIYNSTNFFLCDTTHHRVGYISLDNWFSYLSDGKDIKGELHSRFYLLDGADILLLRREEEKRIKVTFRGLNTVYTLFSDAEVATELYYALVNVRNENASFQTALSDDQFENNPTCPPETTDFDDTSDASESADFEDESDDYGTNTFDDESKWNEDETDDDSFDEESEESGMPSWIDIFPAPIRKLIFDTEEENFDSDLSDEAPNEVEHTAESKPIIAESARPASDKSSKNATSPEHINASAPSDTATELGNENAPRHITEQAMQPDSNESQSSYLGTCEEPLQQDFSASPTSTPPTSTTSDFENKTITEKPSYSQPQTTPFARFEPSHDGIGQSDNEEQSLNCPRCGSSDLFGETVVTCRKCGHQFFR